MNESHLLRESKTKIAQIKTVINEKNNEEQNHELECKTLSGVVVSDKADKTITVKVERKVKHPKYGKIIKRSTKIHAHDESNSAKMGDVVTVQECKPYSKNKTWLLIDSAIAGNDKAVEVEETQSNEEPSS